MAVKPLRPLIKAAAEPTPVDMVLSSYEVASRL
jgi:hypothetical protein